MSKEEWMPQLIVAAGCLSVAYICYLGLNHVDGLRGCILGLRLGRLCIIDSLLMTAFATGMVTLGAFGSVLALVGVMSCILSFIASFVAPFLPPSRRAADARYTPRDREWQPPPEEEDQWEYVKYNHGFLTVASWQRKSRWWQPPPEEKDQWEYVKIKKRFFRVGRWRRKPPKTPEKQRGLPPHQEPRQESTSRPENPKQPPPPALVDDW